MTLSNLDRRKFISAAVIAGAGHNLLPGTGNAAAEVNSDFTYEIVRTDDEWKATLDPETYKILRQGDTEWPKSSELWDKYADGKFSCVGCGLTNYDSIWRVPLDKGWVFFAQSVPNALLMGVDGDPPQGMGDESLPANIEVHCRRCGSHMGHIVRVENKVVHCINGKALIFTPA